MPEEYQYRVTALTRADQPLCSETITVAVPGDPQLLRTVRRTIVPIAGTVAGANGSLFRTSLSLHRRGNSLNGRLVFHPAGKVASDSDPFVRYDFSDGTTVIDFDDFGAAIGQTGRGSIDVVPDEGPDAYAPSVDVRLYNDGPAGRFGAYTRAVWPGNFIKPVGDSFIVPAATFRVNVGFRTLTDTIVIAAVEDSTGHRTAEKFLTLPADWTEFNALQTLFDGTSINQGDIVSFRPYQGSFIAFHTFTDNTSNDPEFFVPDAGTTPSFVARYPNLPF